MQERNKRKWLAAGLLVGVLALTLSACGGGGDGGGGDGGEDGAPTALDVSAAEFSFTPNALTAPADTEVTVNLTNGGTIEHDITIDEAGLKVLASAGQSASGSFTLAAGSYTFYCSVPGHREAGMEGTLTVS